MSGLPDELWRQILEIGIRNTKFSYKDLCCVSIVCRRLRRLSDDLWSHLLSLDFPPPLQQPNPSTSNRNSASRSAKSTYKIRYEREKEKMVAAHRRAVLRKESEIFERERKMKELETRLSEETQKMKATATELSNLHKVRQASVALNVWQPQMVRGRQKEIVEQCVVSADSRVHSLEMELKLCKQQIAGFSKAYRDEERRLGTAKQELASMKYHPLRDCRPMSSGDSECNKKRKKLKKCLDCKEPYQGSTGELPDIVLLICNLHIQLDIHKFLCLTLMPFTSSGAASFCGKVSPECMKKERQSGAERHSAFMQGPEKSRTLERCNIGSFTLHLLQEVDFTAQTRDLLIMRQQL